MPFVSLLLVYLIDKGWDFPIQPLSEGRLFLFKSVCRCKMLLFKQSLQLSQYLISVPADFLYELWSELQPTSCSHLCVFRLFP